MRELTPNEIDMVSAGPSAITPLALVDQCNGSMLNQALPGIIPVAATSILSTDPLAIA